MLLKLGLMLLLTFLDLNNKVNLFDFRLRHYSPDIGRFLQRDLISSDNLYRFLENNPLNKIDLMGLERSSSSSSDEA